MKRTWWVARKLAGAPTVFVMLVAGVLSVLAAPAKAASGGDPVITVNTTADLRGVAAGRGVCRDAAGTCSLRAAVMVADTSLRHTTIILPAGHYKLTIPPPVPG
jgi:hypothetical protein